MKKKTSKQKLQENMIKTIIKHCLMEMDLAKMLQFANFDQKVQQRLMGELEPLKSKDPKKYQELQKEIEKDVVDAILSKLGKEQSEPTSKFPPPAARKPEERSQIAAALAKARGIR